MPLLKRRPKSQSRPDVSKVTQPTLAEGADASAGMRPRRRIWLFRLLALIVPSLLLLGGSELVLRLIGYGYSTGFFKPATVQGERCLVDNDRFGLQFFPPELARSPSPVVMRAQKPPDTYRIFLLGESAALGDPAPAFGAGRYLQTLLRERYPGTDFEVVCAAMTAINSHALLPIARECARLEGDLWIVYMGNNEMVGPFGAATVFGAKAPPGWLVRAKLALQQTRLHQALTSMVRQLRSDPEGRTWEGMKLFMENQLAPDDPARETVHRNFRANLEDILRAGERAGVPIILSTVAVNLKDLPPFASMPSRVAGTNLPADFKRAVADATPAQAAGDWPTAIRLYEAAAQMSPLHAETQYRLGQCQLAVSNRTAALTAFSRARDFDALPFRTDSRLNAIIAETGRAHTPRGVHLFDAAATLAEQCAVGIPGDELFYEHVHFHFDGNYRLARELADRIVPLLPASITARGSSSWATQEQCERQLGLSDWNRRDVLDNVLRRLTQPPFTGQRDNPGRRARWQAQLNQVKQRLTTNQVAAAQTLHTEAIQHRPADFRLHWNYAEFLEAVRKVPQAIEEWRTVGSLIPQHHVPPYQLGRLILQQGRPAEARPWLNQAVALRPDLGAGWLELGLLSYGEAKYEEALQHFSRARALVPQEPSIPYHTAQTLVRLKRPDEAMKAVREALRLDPDYWEAHALLGEELAFAGQEAEAQREFETTIRLNPGHAWTHLNLGVVHFKQGRREQAVREFEEALRLNPHLPQARRYLEELKEKSPTRTGSPSP